MTPRLAAISVPLLGRQVLTGPFSNGWWLSLVCGVVSATALSLLGKVAVELHDNHWIPFLFNGILGRPTRWVLSGVLMFFLVWRADVPSVRGQIAAFLGGVWMGILLLYDFWYHYPFLVAVWAGFLAWRVGWHLWSYPGGAVAMMIVPLVVFAGAACSFSALSWDNRFTVGASTRFNTIATATLLGAAAATLLAVIYAIVRLGLFPRPPRPPLVELIEQEPRMTRYLDAVRVLTGSRIKNSMRVRARLPVVVSNLPASWLDSGIFRGNNVGPAPVKAGVGPWVRVLRGSARRLQWMGGFGLLKVPLVPTLARFFRTPSNAPGLGCEALSRLLREGVEREFGRWCAARNGEGLLHFARSTALREALVETTVYFGRGVEEWSVADKARRLHQAFFVRGGEPLSATPAEAVWIAAEREYEQLWVQNCERLFLVRGDKFTLPFLDPDDLLDPGAIRVALRDKSAEATWVVDRLRAGGRASPLIWEQTATPRETADLQLVDALNGLIDQASTTQPAGVRGHGQQAAALSTRRVEMLRVRTELERTFRDALAPINDMVDLNKLSLNWLVSRLASGGPVSVHRAACHLALAVFALEKEDASLAASIANSLGETYLNLHGGGSPLARTAGTLEDKTEAARCNLLCALWQAHLGHWLHARQLMTTGLLDASQEHVTEPILRATAHLHAALLQLQHRAGGPASGQLENEIGFLLRQFADLDSRTREKLLLPACIPGHVLAREFAIRLGVDFNSNV